MADTHPAEVAGSNPAPPNTEAITGALPTNRVAGLVRTVDPGVASAPVRFCTLRCTLTLKSVCFMLFSRNVSRYLPRFLAFPTTLTRWKSLVRIQRRPLDLRRMYALS